VNRKGKKWGGLSYELVRPKKSAENGKYYCGKPLDINCPSCDGFCGPTNGC
jgi:hypothetical protein